ncbi:MAG: type II toxin-antitoxin system VapC family toxin [Gemmatimonadales bacterium]
MLDASAVVELLVAPGGGTHVARRIGFDRSLHAPAILDLEVAHTIRRLCALRELAETRGHAAIADLGDLPVRRYPHTPLLERVWQLRRNLTAYDAAYVALAEALAAPLVTRDRRLAASRGHRARVELV